MNSNCYIREKYVIFLLRGGKMKHELLSPAGDMESLYQAIHNGADAIYVGLKQFGARHYAKNFSKSEMKEAIKLCHLYGVRLYATMNILIKDYEVSEFLNMIEFLHQEGIDAVIMQDFGMICLVRQMFPNLEIHASTQANNSSIETLELLSSLGVKRVVLPREMSLDEIKKISVDIELEVFIHGALCISCSGLCYMSSMLGSRSGNRGECVGNCRLKYDLIKAGKTIVKEKYLLSTKELNTSRRFLELCNSNIYSFKIEGRMKSAEYVGFITRLYRKLIDQEEISLEEELEKLKMLFHRGFTTGNLFKNKNMMNPNSPNHIGLEIGKVVDVNKKYIKIKLKKELNQEDGIRFLESNKGFIVNYLYDSNKKLVSSSSNIVILDNKIGLTSLDYVYKTIDKKQIDQLKKISPKKIPVKISVVAKIGQKLKIKIDDFNHIIEEETSIVEEAKTSSISKERIKKQVERLGSSPFCCRKVEILMDSNIFISIGKLNEIRRKAVEKLIHLRQNQKIPFVKKKVEFSYYIEQRPQNELTASVMKESQLITCLKLGFQRIYVNDLSLYQKYQQKKAVYYSIDYFPFKVQDFIKERTLISQNMLFSNYTNIYGNYFLNITNLYSAYYLLKNGLSLVPVSVELNNQEILFMKEKFYEKTSSILPLEILVYGRVCNMTIEGNILKLNNDLDCSLKDYKNRYFKAFYRNGKTYILNHEVVKKKIDFGFPYVKRFDFFDETEEEIIAIVKKLK